MTDVPFKGETFKIKVNLHFFKKLTISQGVCSEISVLYYLMKSSRPPHRESRERVRLKNLPQVVKITVLIHIRHGRPSCPHPMLLNESLKELIKN